MNLKVERVYKSPQSRDSTKDREKKRQQNLTLWQQEFQKAKKKNVTYKPNVDTFTHN